MTTDQLQDQRIAQTRQQLDSADASRFIATGGADLGLAWSLEYFGGDLAVAGGNGDVATWRRAMHALRALVAQQQEGENR